MLAKQLCMQILQLPGVGWQNLEDAHQASSLPELKTPPPPQILRGKVRCSGVYSELACGECSLPTWSTKTLSHPCALWLCCTLPAMLYK